MGHRRRLSSGFAFAFAFVWAWMRGRTGLRLCGRSLVLVVLPSFVGFVRSDFDEGSSGRGSVQSGRALVRGRGAVWGVWV